jgi:hypothetical protein
MLIVFIFQKDRSLLRAPKSLPPLSLNLVH